jgi:hypothetical protein
MVPLRLARTFAQLVTRLRHLALPPSRVRKPFTEAVTPGLVVVTVVMLSIGQLTAAAIAGVGAVFGIIALAQARRR